jgi:tripartite-type tricarboxylate transporter receptor subunit TctC
VSVRSTILFCGVAALLSAATAAPAEDYPVRPVRLVVPASAGSSADVGARVFAQKLSGILKQNVIVENKVGAGGRLGAADVARAAPDGYTLLYGTSITQALFPALAKSVTYDPLKDFTPLGQTFWFATVIACNAKVPFSDLRGLIEYAKANPDVLTFANSGLGGGNHFSNELLATMAGIRIKHVPFRGNAPGVQAVVANFVNCTSQTEIKSFVESGQLRAFATTGKERDPRFPDLPTVGETGLTGYEMTWWHAVYAPAGAPSPIVQTLKNAVKQVAEDAQVASQTLEIGLIQQYRSPAEVSQQTATDIEKFRQIARESQIRLD